MIFIIRMMRSLCVIRIRITITIRIRIRPVLILIRMIVINTNNDICCHGAAYTTRGTALGSPSFGRLPCRKRHLQIRRSSATVGDVQGFRV